MKAMSFIMKLFLIIFLTIILLAGCKTKEPEDPFVIKPGKSLNIPIEDIHEGVNYFHAFVDDIYMEILVIKTSEDEFRTAYNTCERCYVLGHGYFILDEEDEILCFQCKMPVSIDDIGIKTGGCFPIPIFDDERTVTDDSIQIPYETLSANTQWFLNWKIENEPEPDPETEEDSDLETEDSIDS